MTWSKLHDCKLKGVEVDREHFVIPSSSLWLRAKWWYKELVSVSETNSMTRYFFKSRHAVQTEKRRQYRSRYWYVLHPLSGINGRLQPLTCVLWLVAFFVDPLSIAYLQCAGANYEGFRRISLFINVYLMVFSITTFFTGYVDTHTRECVISLPRIVKRYLTTYFLVDVFGFMPVNYLLMQKDSQDMDSTTVYLMWTVSWLQTARIARFWSIFGYTKRIMDARGFDHVYIVSVITAVFLWYFNHLASCLLTFFAPELLYHKGRYVPWISDPNADDVEVELLRPYLYGLYTSTLHLYNVNAASELVNAQQYVIVTCLVAFGLVLKLVILAQMLCLVTSSNISESKYLDVLNQLGDYGDVNQLPPRLKARLVAYYCSLFKGSFVQRSLVRAQLSERLLNEIGELDCQRAFNKVTLLNGMASEILLKLFKKCRREYYLKNDVVFKVGDRVLGIIFLCSGETAGYEASGIEYFRHHNDGDVLGTLGFVSECRFVASQVALETTEALICTIEDVRELCAEYPELNARFMQDGTFRKRLLEKNVQHIQQKAGDLLTEYANALEALREVH